VVREIDEGGEVVEGHQPVEVVTQRAFGGEHRCRVLHRLGGGEQQRQRRDDEPEAEVGQLGRREQGRPTGLHHVGHQRAARQRRGDGLQLGDALGSLHEQRIHAAVTGHPRPLDGLLQPRGGPGVGAGRDEDVRSVVAGGPELGQPLPPRHHLLARHVTAALGPHLVLEEQPGRPGLLPQRDRADRVERVAVPRVGVHHHEGAGHGRADPAGHLGLLGLREVAVVG
jgi:hypothetical protein